MQDKDTLSPFERTSIFTLPNLLSISRIVLLLPALFFLYTERIAYAISMLALIVLSDGLDGYIARKLNNVSEIGKVLDHSVDKFVIISITYAMVQLRGFPLFIFWLLLFRELLTLLLGVYIWRRKGVVGQSNLLGRVGGIMFSITIFLYIINFGLKEVALYLTIVFLLVVSLNYMRIYLFSENSNIKDTN